MLHEASSVHVTGFAKNLPLMQIHSSINKLTNYNSNTAKSWLIFFFCGLFLRPVRHLLVFGCPLNATGRVVQAATLQKITTWLIHDVGHGFIYIWWHFKCMGSYSRPFHLENCWASLLTCHFVVTHHPPPSTPLYVLVVLIKQSRMAENSASCALWSG